MTHFLSIVSNFYYFQRHDTSLYDAPMNRQPRPFYVPQVSRAYGNEYTLGWTRGGLQGGDAPMQAITDSGAYDPYLQATLFVGGGGWLKFTGVTRDSGGSVLGNTLVQLFHTSDDAFIQQQTTDATGAYDVYSPYSDGHYLVAYKAGSPDVAGTTVNTITGT